MDHTTEMILREAICEIRDEIIAAIRPRELTRAEEVERLAERIWIGTSTPRFDDEIGKAFEDAERFIANRDRRRAEREAQA